VDLVRPHGALLQVAQDHERVVVSLHAEGALAGREDGDLARSVGLDPDRRLRAARVAEKRSENEPGFAVGRIWKRPLT
jgi:hypothetical protein